MIEKGVYSFDFPQFSLVSDEAKDLIKRCLVPEAKRITTQEILLHTWMTSEAPKSNLKFNVENIIKYTKKGKLEKVVLNFIASQLDEKQILELGVLFKQLDKNQDGVLSLAEMKEGIQNVHAGTASEIQKIFAKLDSDGSGTIDYTGICS